MEDYHDWRDEGDYLVLVVKKEWDLEIVRFLYREFDYYFDEKRHKHFAVEVRSVDYLDSLALGFLVNASKKIEPGGGCLLIVEPRQNLRKVIRDTGLMGRMKVFDSEKEMLSFLGKPGPSD